jgi:radical SAM protein with 4Fe4S-binding SPASM domain
LINERCTECKYRPICNTCAAAALLETGDYEGIPEYICEYTKEFYKIMKERR